jgi:hypothetical protein
MLDLYTNKWTLYLSKNAHRYLSFRVSNRKSPHCLLLSFSWRFQCSVPGCFQGCFTINLSGMYYLCHSAMPIFLCRFSERKICFHLLIIGITWWFCGRNIATSRPLIVGYLGISFSSLRISFKYVRCVNFHFQIWKQIRDMFPVLIPKD